MTAHIFVFVVVLLAVKYTLEFGDRRSSRLVQRAKRLRRWAQRKGPSLVLDMRSKPVVGPPVLEDPTSEVFWQRVLHDLSPDQVNPVGS